MDFERELGEGFGELKDAFAEPDRDGALFGVDVAGGESGDAGDGLGVGLPRVQLSQSPLVIERNVPQPVHVPVLAPCRR